MGSQPISASWFSTEVMRTAWTTYSVPRRDRTTRSPFLAAVSSWSMRSTVQRICDNDDLTLCIHPAPDPNVTRGAVANSADNGRRRGLLGAQLRQQRLLILGRYHQEQPAGRLGVDAEIPVGHTERGIPLDP